MDAPEGTTELGIDIIKVERIRDALARHGDRFPKRILTDAERAYVRDRPENLAGRWAAKEAVSKVLGPGRAGRRLARDRDRPAAHRPADRPAPRPGAAACRAAGHGAHRGVHQPRARVRGRHRVRHPHAGRRVRLPGRHRGAPRRPRAADPGADASACATWRRRGPRAGGSRRSVAGAADAGGTADAADEPRPKPGRPRPSGSMPRSSHRFLPEPPRGRAQGHVRVAARGVRIARLDRRGAARRDGRAAGRGRPGDRWRCPHRCSRSSRDGSRSSSRWASPETEPWHRRRGRRRRGHRGAARTPALLVGPGLRPGAGDHGPGAASHRGPGRLRAAWAGGRGHRAGPCGHRCHGPQRARGAPRSGGSGVSGCAC